MCQSAVRLKVCFILRSYGQNANKNYPKTAFLRHFFKVLSENQTLFSQYSVWLLKKSVLSFHTSVYFCHNLSGGGARNSQDKAAFNGLCAILRQA
jgi:hypothetical protein